MYRFLFWVFFSFISVVSAPAWSQVSVSSNPSATGSYAISWPSNLGNVFVVEEKDNSGTRPIVYQGSATQVALSGKTNGSYEYEVFDVNGGGCHPWIGCVPSSVGTVTVTVALVVSPGTPGSISAPSVSSGSYQTSWSAASGDVDSYQLQEAANGGGWNTVQTTSAMSKSFSKPQNNYYDYRVRACNDVGCSSYTSVKRVSVPLPAPGVPGAISAPSTSTSGMYSVSWGSASGVVDRYELHERMNGGAWATVQNTTSRSKSFSKPADSYFDYRVRACNSSGCSGFTANKRVAIPAGTVSASASPSSYTYIPASVSLSWSSSMSTGCRVFGNALPSTSGSTSINVPTSVWQQDPTLNTWSASIVVSCDQIGGAVIQSSPVVISASMYEQRPTVSASWSNTNLFVNETAVLSWNSTRADTCRIDGTSVGLSGSQPYSYSSPGTFSKTVTCENLGGDRSSSASVSVSLPPPPTVSVFWSASSSSLNTATAFSWSSSGGDTCTLDGQSVSASGTANYSFATTGYHTKTVRCSNAGGSAEDVATLAVFSSNTSLPAAVDPADMSDTDEVFFGYTGGNFSVTPSGSARYSLPLTVAPGIAGMQPNLALSYSSNGKNGALGWGWSLGGLSSIHRCPADNLRDGYVSGVFDDDAYKLCLDGQRLVEVTSGEYRTERESQKKIVSSGAGYLVYLPNGRVVSYGTTAQARKAPVGGSAAMSWHINRVEDPVGNFMTYHYENDAASGILRIERIEYTKNAVGNLPNVVAFGYEVRDDIISGYRGGVFYQQDERLANIDVSVSGALVRRYVLDYEPFNETHYADLAKTSRLQYVRMCFDENETQCTIPLHAEWASRTSTDFAFNPTTLVPGGGSFDAYLIGDYDGDGKQEYVYQDSGIQPNNIYQTDSTQAPSYGGGQHKVASNGRAVLDKADVDGDGKDDLILRDSSGQLWLSTATPSGFASPTLLLTQADSLVYNMYFQDMNGDGYVDMLRNPSTMFLPPPGGHFERFERIDVALNNKNGGFDAFTQWGNRIGGYHGSLKIADMNGDGLPDVVRCEYQLLSSNQENNKCRFTVSLNTGSGFNDPVYWGSTEIDAMTWVRRTDPMTNQVPQPEQHFVLADVNGDRLADVVWATKTDVQVAINNGRDFNAFTLWLNQDITPDSWYAPPFTLADLNGDQRVDLVYRNDGDNALFVAYNRGASAGMANNGGFTYPRALGISSMFFMGIDVNDDGLSDLSFAQADGDFMKTARLNGNDVAVNALPQHRIHAFHINDERDIAITYAHLNNPNVHTMGAATVGTTGDILSDQPLGTTVTVDEQTGSVSTYQSVSTNAPYVVDTVTTSNGIGSTTTSDYHYTGYLSHRGGWGGLGFEKTEVTRTVNATGEQIRTVSEYVQEVGDTYNAAGLLATRTQYADDALGELQQISRTQTIWYLQTLNDDIDGFSSPHFRVIRDSSHSRSQELNGALVANVSQYAIRYSNSAPTACYTANITDFVHVIPTQYPGTDTYGNIHQNATVVCDGSQTHTTATKNTYENRTSGGQWLLGLVTNSQTTHTAPDADGVVKSLTREVSATYTTQGFPNTQVREPNNSDLLRTTTFSNYDAYGNAQTITESWNDSEGLGFTSRSSTMSVAYATNGDSTITATNAAGHESITVIDGRFGSVKSQTDVGNNLTTTYSYDALGRIETIIAPDGASVVTRYRVCNNCEAPSANARHYVHTKATGASPQRTYYDTFNREVGQRALGLTGVPSYTQIDYNAAGRVHKASQPFFAGSERFDTVYTYDSLGRITNMLAPNDGGTVTQYNGLETTVTNALSQQKVTWQNGLGQTVRVHDDNGTEIAYAYDPFGNLEQTEVTPFDGGSSVVTTMAYDLLGRQLYLDDPSAGRVNYQYNGLDLMVHSTDAKNQRTQFSYDALGRQITRIDNALAANAATRTHEWFYDTPNSGDGRLDSVVGFDTDGQPYSEGYSYNSYGLPTTMETAIDGQSYTTTTHYDAFNRPVAIDYPTGYSVINHFNDYGYRHQVVDGVSGTPLWTASAADALGNITASTHGNNVQTTREYDPATGMVESIHALGNNNLVVQNQDFQFDVLGNLVERADLRVAFVEAFCYDNLNRLQAVRQNSCSQTQQDVTYDALGNIQTRVMPQGGTQSYSYNGSNPYRLASTNLAGSYGYDANGNITSGDGRSITYSSFDKPTRMTKDGNVVDIAYGSDQMRIKRVDNNSVTTIYVAGIYEKQTEGTATKHIHYVGDIAIQVWEEENNSLTDTYTRYLHHDHIGSLVAKTNEEADSVDDVEWFANDPWGLRREQSWLGVILGTDYVPEDTRRGFTGHEHMDGVGLIHMNGRVYDPNVGRFLSADPIIQAPSNTQSYNRYAYVFNNPLRYTDPSGYTAGGNGGEQDVSQACGATPNCSVMWVNPPDSSAAGSSLKWSSIGGTPHYQDEDGVWQHYETLGGSQVDSGVLIGGMEFVSLTASFRLVSNVLSGIPNFGNGVQGTAPGMGSMYTLPSGLEVVTTTASSSAQGGQVSLNNAPGVIDNFPLKADVRQHLMSMFGNKDVDQVSLRMALTKLNNTAISISRAEVAMGVFDATYGDLQKDVLIGVGATTAAPFAMYYFPLAVRAAWSNQHVREFAWDMGGELLANYFLDGMPSGDGIKYKPVQDHRMIPNVDTGGAPKYRVRTTWGKSGVIKAIPWMKNYPSR